MSLVHRSLPLRRPAVLAIAVFSVLAMLLARAPQQALAFSATGGLSPNGTGTGAGFSTTTFGTGAASSVQITLQGARPNAIYQIYTCLGLTTGGFSCVGRNNPPLYQQVLVSPKAIAPVTVTLALQGTLTTDAGGNGSTTISIPTLLLPDTPASLYNVVQLVNIADATDSYTGVDMQSPALPVAGVNSYVPVGLALAIGVPVWVLAQFPGYAYPVSITTLGSAPFVPFWYLPLGVFSNPFPFTFTNGLCPNGNAPFARPGFYGFIAFTC